MKVYTRGGDTGDTSLFGGARVSKSDPRVEAYGAVDELNAVIGLALTEIPFDDLRRWLIRVQSSLFDLGGEFATPDVEERAGKGKGIPRVDDDDVAEIERWIDAMDEEIEPLRSFVLPGGAPGAAWLHAARTVCRRAERRVISLAATEPVAPRTIRYLNRLSDLLFTAARTVNHRTSTAEPTWSGRQR